MTATSWCHAGKSCLLDRYVTGAFEADAKNTVGTAFAAKRVRARLSRVASLPCCAIVNEAQMNHRIAASVQIKVSSGCTISVGVWDTGARTPRLMVGDADISILYARRQDAARSQPHQRSHTCSLRW